MTRVGGDRLSTNIGYISSRDDWDIPKLDHDNDCITLNLL